MNYFAGNIVFDARQCDIHSLVSPLREEFEREVEAGNFLRGGKSLLVTGPSAEAEVEKWAACLRLAQMPVYRTTAFEIGRRVNGLSVLWDSEERKADFEEAETIVISGFFAGDGYEDGEHIEQLVRWYIEEGLRNGLVFVIASDSDTPSLEHNGRYIGGLVEENFEVINAASSKTTTGAGIKKRKRQHGRATTTVGGNQ